jgi:protein SCO1/2
MRRRACLVAAALALGVGGANGHDRHGAADAAAPVATMTADSPFPGSIGGPFRLIDQTGAARREADPDGRVQLVFFGYATCPGICSHALPTLAALTDALAQAGAPATPVLITVDPARDTPEALAGAAAAIHPDLVALTGSAAELAAVRAAFQVESELVFVSPEHGEVYAHGSYIYVLDGEGRFLTLLPPILSVERMVEIVAGYVGG